MQETGGGGSLTLTEGVSKKACIFDFYIRFTHMFHGVRSGVLRSFCGECPGAFGVYVRGRLLIAWGVRRSYGGMFGGVRFRAFCGVLLIAWGKVRGLSFCVSA